jgi:SAM-dependent methyltransferase
MPGTIERNFYDVVTCENCGFAFANNIPQPDPDAYYETSDRHLHAAALPAGLAEAHRTFFEFVLTSHPHLHQDATILDVGSSMGHFLNRFRTAGFTNIQGLEPSSAASELARETYGISVTAATLEDFQPKQKFDLITLCGVLEHLDTLQNTASRINDLLTDDGYLFIAVPDGSSFGDAPPREPFLEFALEHINFFTAGSLDNLLLPHGFNTVASTSLWNDFYANSYLLALYQKKPGANRAILPDPTGQESLNRYIAFSNDGLSGIRKKIDALQASNEPVVIWGAGSLASRLCATTNLAECNILAFVDANSQLHGQFLLDRPIHPPTWLEQHRNTTVFITSYVYSQEISQLLIDNWQWSGQIVTM